MANQRQIHETTVLTPEDTRAITGRESYEFYDTNGEMIATVRMTRLTTGALKVTANDLVQHRTQDVTITDGEENFLYNGIIVYATGRTYITGQSFARL